MKLNTMKNGSSNNDNGMPHYGAGGPQSSLLGAFGSVDHQHDSTAESYAGRIMAAEINDDHKVKPQGKTDQKH